MDESLLKLFSRLKSDPDGGEFIAYLKILSQENYRAFKTCSTDMNDIHKGFALAYDSLLDSFASCAQELEKLKVKQEVPNIHY